MKTYLLKLVFQPLFEMLIVKYDIILVAENGITFIIENMVFQSFQQNQSR
jgi:hypothetical protein